MRILLVTQYYYPEPVEKVHDLARGLVRLGHEVEVVTGFPCYPLGETYAGYRQGLPKRETLDGVSVLRVPQIPDHSTSALRRVVYYVSFAVSAALFGLLRTRRADVILVYQAAFPVGLAAWLISRVRRVPYVLDVVDLWPESVISTGMLRNALAAAIIRGFVRFIYRGAARISVVTDGFRRNLLALGVPASKLTVIHNWMPADTYERVPYDAQRAEREGMAGRFNVLYAGNIGAPQGLETVLEAAKLLRDLPAVQFVLAGGGVMYDSLVAAAEREGLTNVRFLGRRPPEEMAPLYALAGALLVHLKPDALTEVSIPSKTFAYMAAAKPVIMAVKGDAAEFVEQEKFGIAVPPSDPRALADAVRWIASQPAPVREEMSAAAIHAYDARYRSGVQIHRMADLLNDAAGGSR